MDKYKLIDFLTYRSWYYQVYWYKMRKEDARKLFKDAKEYEKIKRGENSPQNGK